jgi:hypothetical protein
VFEQVYELRCFLAPGHGKRCVPVLIRGVRTGSGSQQAAHHGQVSAQCGDEKCRASASIGLFGTGSATKKLLELSEIS